MAQLCGQRCLNQCQVSQSGASPGSTIARAGAQEEWSLALGSWRWGPMLLAAPGSSSSSASAYSFSSSCSSPLKPTSLNTAASCKLERARRLKRQSFSHLAKINVPKYLGTNRHPPPQSTLHRGYLVFCIFDTSLIKDYINVYWITFWF